MGNTYTKRDLIIELARNTKASQKLTGLMLEELIKIAYRESKTGFTLPGICKIDVTLRKERRARNPVTGATMLIGAHNVIRLRPLKKAKDAIAPTPPNLITILPPSETVPVAPAPIVAESPAPIIPPAPPQVAAPVPSPTIEVPQAAPEPVPVATAIPPTPPPPVVVVEESTPPVAPTQSGS